MKVINKLEELAKLFSGISYSSEDYSDKANGNVFVNLKCIKRGGGFSLKGIKYYKGEYKEKNLVFPEDLIIAVTDLTKDAQLVGSPLFLPNIITEKKILISMDLAKLEVDETKILKKYLFYYLTQPKVRQYMKENSRGTTVLHLDKDAFRNLEIRYPIKISDQRNVIKVLDCVDNNIKIVEEKINKLELIKKGIISSLIENSSFPLKTIKDCCDILDNKRKPLNGIERDKIKGNIPYYGANNIQGYINSFIFDEPLVLLAEDGGNFDEYCSKPIAYKIAGKSWVNNHAHVLRAKSEVLLTDFLYFSLVHKNIISYIVGGGRSKLNKSDLELINIKVPSIPKQKEIVNSLNSIEYSISCLILKKAKVDKIKKGLMERFFNE